MKPCLHRALRVSGRVLNGLWPWHPAVALQSCSQAGGEGWCGVVFDLRHGAGLHFSVSMHGWPPSSLWWTMHDAIKTGAQRPDYDEAVACIGSLQSTVTFSGCLSVMT